MGRWPLVEVPLHLNVGLSGQDQVNFALSTDVCCLWNSQYLFTVFIVFYSSQDGVVWRKTSQAVVQTHIRICPAD